MILAASYCLNRNNRVSSFYKTRGSKLCFLACFSYFSRYFHILVFLQNCYLLISLRLSWLHGNLISCPVFFVPLAFQASTSYMRPHISGTKCVGFSKQDTRGELVVDSLPVIFPLFRLSPKISHAHVHWTECKSYLLYSLKPLEWHFLVWHRPCQATQYSLGMESPQDLQTCEKGWLLGSLCFAQSNSVGLPCYKILCSGFLNVPLPYGMRLKVSPEGPHIFEQLSSPMAQKCRGCDAQ